MDENIVSMNMTQLVLGYRSILSLVLYLVFKDGPSMVLITFCVVLFNVFSAVLKFMFHNFDNSNGETPFLFDDEIEFNSNLCLDVSFDNLLML